MPKWHKGAAVASVWGEWQAIAKMANAIKRSKAKKAIESERKRKKAKVSEILGGFENDRD